MKPLEEGDPASVGDGRYRLVGRLGQGGMGVVYFGRSRSGRAVAVKVVRPELSTEPGFRRRFADEVAAARRVGGFHTAPVVDADPHGEPAWLVTAYVPGPTLQAVLDQVGPLPVDTLTVLAAGLAEALAAIHQAGVVHRDLKPANIIIAEDGPRVIDFGIARALDGTALTQTGFQIGTPGFLAPEQLTGGALTPAVDMFALGVVLGQAAGGAPFGDGSSAARHYRVVHEQPDLTGVPDPLRELVAACLAKDPRDRPGPSEFLNLLTVRHSSDGWLPAEATALVRRQDPAASVTTPDRPAVAPTDPRTALSAPPAAAEGRGTAVAAHPPTVQSPPGPGFGPAPDVVPAPTPPSGAPVPLGAPVPPGGAVPSDGPGPAGGGPGRLGGPGPVGGGPGPADGPGPVGGGRPPRGRRRTVAVAALLTAAATAGLLVWHPWTGSGSGDAGDDAGGASPSPRRSTPAAFPDAPLLVRMDTEPGSPDCHSVIGRRDSTTDNPKQLIEGTCDALPQWSPDHRSLAFTRKTSQGSAVWTANADGTGARRVAAISGGRVSWSPDGGRLAVLRRQDGVQQLFVVNVSDGSAQQLTTGGAKVEDPAWSPDGRSIAICLQKTSGWQIHVVDPSRPGGEPRQVTHQSRRALDPVWSPDGRYFAYTAGAPGEGTGGDIRVVRTDGTDDRKLVETAAQEMDPVWAPGGKWVAFVRGPFDAPALWAVRADGTGERRLTTGSVPEGHPSWR